MILGEELFGGRVGRQPVEAREAAGPGEEQQAQRPHAAQPVGVGALARAGLALRERPARPGERRHAAPVDLVSAGQDLAGFLAALARPEDTEAAVVPPPRGVIPAEPGRVICRLTGGGARA